MVTCYTNFMYTYQSFSAKNCLGICLHRDVSMVYRYRLFEVALPQIVDAFSPSLDHVHKLLNT